ncbi:MAG: phosphopantetheine-binding protein [Mycoplasmataceae bacterium]|jgi:acyl carrier protein|nr:phosphopantetheine-binding protein [Mycoplasmataceae bacterium]
MSQNKVIDAINQVVQERNIKLTVSSANKQMTLKELGIDSLEAMGIIVGVEQSLNVHLPDEILANMRTLGDLINAFEKQLK